MNSIRSVYPKDNRQIANWIDEGLLEYADKERMSEWLSKQQSNSADVRQQLERAANVIKDYKNPKESGENNNTEDYTRFRAGGNKRRMPGTGEQSKKTTIAPAVSSIRTTKIIKNLDNATVSNFDANGEKEGISIVITRKPTNCDLL